MFDGLCKFLTKIQVTQ